MPGFLRGVVQCRIGHNPRKLRDAPKKCISMSMSVYARLCNVGAMLCYVRRCETMRSISTCKFADSSVAIDAELAAKVSPNVCSANPIGVGVGKRTLHASQVCSCILMCSARTECYPYEKTRDLLTISKPSCQAAEYEQAEARAEA